MSARPNVVFVSRRYPPSVGGMETLARAVHLALDEYSDTTLVALGRAQHHLAWFLPYAALRARRSARPGRADRIVFGDALVYAMVRPVLPRSAPPCTVMVHGLDLTFPSRPYRAMVRAALPKADRVVANSHSTAAIAREMGVAAERCVVLNPGVEIPAPWPGTHAEAARQLRQRFAIAAGTPVLVTLGRLVERKGVAWFVRDVLPALAGDPVFLVAGKGPLEAAIQEATAARNLESRVQLLGAVDDDTRALLFAGCDAFVMPNIPVAGDVEGFGLVAIEASNAGALVVAAGLEGIVDAVSHDTTGYLCAPRDVADWTARLDRVLADPAASRATAERFTIASRRRSSFERMAAELPVALGVTGATGAASSEAGGSGPASQEQQRP